MGAWAAALYRVKLSGWEAGLGPRTKLDTDMETGGSKGRGCRGKGTGGLKLGWVRFGGGWEEEKSTGSVWTTWVVGYFSEAWMGALRLP